MRSGVSRTIDRFRQPEYTGENRCIPCTSVNVAIALALAAVVGRRRRGLGVAVLGVSLAAIYVRGYLVPGTPTLTKRYFPDWLLALFDKAPEPVDGDGAVVADLDAVLDPEATPAEADATEDDGWTDLTDGRPADDTETTA